MLGSIITGIFTGGISSITDAIRDVKIARISNENKRNNIVKELELERLKAEQKAVLASKEIRAATKGFLEVRLAAAIIVLPTALHYAFTVLDATYNFGWNIQPLPTPVNEYQKEIVLGALGIYTVNGGISVLAARLLKS